MLKIVLIVAFIGLVSAQYFNPRTPRQSHPPRARPPTARPSVSSTSRVTSGNTKDIEVVRSEFENNGDGTYSYRYELTDGTIVEQTGSLRPPLPGSDEPIQVAEGSYQYYSPEGELYLVTYKADEHGYQPTGSHLPTPPPIPPEIVKSIQLSYANAGKQVKAASGR